VSLTGRVMLIDIFCYSF